METNRGWVVAIGLAVVVLAGGVLVGARRYWPRPERTSPREIIVESFPLAVGTTWVYDYVPYEPLPSNPRTIISATYTLTETVVAEQDVEPYRLVTVAREFRLRSGRPTTLNLPATRAWYVVSGDVIFEVRRPPDIATFQPADGVVAYRLPLTLGKQWCPTTDSYRDPTTGAVRCFAQQTVADVGSHDTPVGRFERCAYLTQAVNSGGVNQWLCDGIGVVEARYDHGGTRFGFRQTLVHYIPPASANR